MNVKTILPAAALLLAAVPLSLAHDGATGSTVVGPNPACWPAQDPHDYGGAGSLAYGASSAGTGSVGAAYASDGNVGDCDGDGEPGDFDGDREFGLGGGFFPAGVWAADPTCDYGLVAHHGPSFIITAEDIAQVTDVRFTVGADPTPPTLVPSSSPADDDGFDCVTDGAVTPGVDADDWYEHGIRALAVSGPPGGDGGWWLWIDCAAVVEGDDADAGLADGDGDGVPDGASPRLVPPSGAAAACAFAGHVSAS